MTGLVSKSDTTMLWSDIPGMLVEFLRSEGFVVKVRSRIAESRVGWV